MNEETQDDGTPTSWSAIIIAPWDTMTVRNLNRFQGLPWIHPYTCGNTQHSKAPRLIATEAGWRCADSHNEGCDYRQNWARAIMANPSQWPIGTGIAQRLNVSAHKDTVQAIINARAAAERLITVLNDETLGEITAEMIDVPAKPAEPERWCCDGNAEDCALCDTGTMPYPWICPGGHDDSPVNRGLVLKAAAETRDRDTVKATMRRLRIHDHVNQVQVDPVSICEEPHETIEEEEEACDVAGLSAIQAWAWETDLAAALGSFGDGYRHAQRDAQIALGRDRIAAREAVEDPGTDPDDLDLPTLRAHASRRLLAIGLERIEREWICCDPVKVSHALCVQGEATRKMLTALLTDDEESSPGTSDFLDEVIRLIQGVGDPHNRRSVLSETEVAELYGNAVRTGFRKTVDWDGVNDLTPLSVEIMREITNAVIATRDRELARNRQRLLLADDNGRRAMVNEQVERDKSAQTAREEGAREARVTALQEALKILREECSSPFEQVAFNNPHVRLMRLLRDAKQGNQPGTAQGD